MENQEKPLAAGHGSAAIARQLRLAITNGQYGYGDRLPPERQLASHFGTSRSTMREALRQLEDMSLVSRRMGSGTFVTYSPQTEDTRIAEITSPLQLVQVRMGLEPQMVRLAIPNATARDLDKLEVALRRVERESEDQEAFSRADEQFHLALAECSGNPLMVWMYRQINSIRERAEWSSVKIKILSPERIQEYNRSHRRLYETVRSRDTRMAEELMREHLNMAQKDLIGAAIE